MAKLRAPFFGPWGLDVSEALSDFWAAWEGTAGLSGKPPSVIVQSAARENGLIGTLRVPSLLESMKQYNIGDPSLIDESDKRFGRVRRVVYEHVTFKQKRSKGRFAKGRERVVTKQVIETPVMYRVIVVEFAQGFEPSPKGRKGKRSKAGEARKRRKAAKRGKTKKRGKG